MIMKKGFQYILAAAIVVLSGCENASDPEPLPVSPEPVQMVFHAVNDPEQATATKAYIDPMNNLQINWSASDRISVYDGVANRCFTLTEGQNTTSATFEGSAIEDADHIALYPYLDAAELSSTSIGKVNLKAEQTAVSGGFDPNCAIMTAYAKEGSTELSFKNAVSYVKVGMEFNCSEIILDAKGVNIAGTLSLSNIDTTPEAYVLSNGSDQVTLVPSQELGYIVAGTYLFAVAPVTLKNGFEIIFHSTDGNYYRKSSSKAPELVRSEVLNLGTFDAVAGVWDAICPWLGNGTADDPYRVYTYPQLTNIATQVANENYTYAHFRVMNDIDCYAQSIASIGTLTCPFKGTIDGGSHTLSNFTFAPAAGDSYRYCGLLGFASGATVKDLALSANTSTLECGSGDAYFGGICGRGCDLTLSNCSLSGTLELERNTSYNGDTPSMLFGSMVGSLTTGSTGISSITGCTSSADIHYDADPGIVYLGSMVGKVYTQALTLTSCSFSGSIDIDNGPNSIHCGMVAQVISNEPFVCENCTEGGTLDIRSRTTVYFGGAVGEIMDYDGSGKQHRIVKFVNESTSPAIIYGYDVKAGGIVGEAYLKNLSIDCCRNRAEIHVDCDDDNPSKLGGILGYIYDFLTIDCEKFLISNCVNEGNLTMVDDDKETPRAYVGGIVGFVDADGTGDYVPMIVNVLNKGNIRILGEKSTAGGLAGSVYDLDTSFYFCVSTATITSDGSSYLGALTGAYFGTLSTTGHGNVERCYYTSTLAAVYDNGCKSGNEFYQTESIKSEDMNAGVKANLDGNTYNGVSVTWAQWKGNWSSEYTSLDLILK